MNACLLPLKSRLSAFSFCFVYVLLCMMTQLIRVYFSGCLFLLDFSMTIDFIGYVLHKLRHSDVATVLGELTCHKSDGGGAGVLSYMG